ncbi:serine hydrolase domain-containing protein [Neptunicella sp. SCSIO 80796]|uniref:serine hydrolase domain-containing protein n=1 Tax=Neptunicella plasticusilytica TaxID=3117012 RepID=UPI003A4E0749
MKRFAFFRTISQVLCALAGLSVYAVAQPQDSGTTEPMPGLESFIDGLVNAQLKNSHIAGGTIAIVKDGQVLMAKGYGYADVKNKVPVSGETTMFRPGSTSKLFTYTAVMQLVEQGKIDLNADANTYLTQFQIPATFEKPVKVVDLLTHTAGFEEKFINMIVFDEKELVPTADFIANTLPERVRPVGQNSSYSNHAVAIAGLIVANVSGMSFDEYVEKNIFQPLGMNSTTFREPLPANLIDNMSNGYTYDPDSETYHQEKFEMVHMLAPAGSSSSTAADMAKFMLAHLNNGSYNGVSILQADTAKKMHSSLYSKNFGGHAMAYGFYQTSYKGLDMIGHGGDLLYFHSDMYLLPEQNFGIFMSFNTADTGETRNIVITSLLDEYFTKQVDVPKSPDNFASKVQNYVGEYQFMRHSSSDFTKSAGLMGGTLSVSAGEDNTILIKPLGGRFAQVNDHLFVSTDFNSPDFSKVTFNLDKNGVADEIYLLPFMHATKLGFFESPSTHQIFLAICAIAFISILVSAFRQRKKHADISKSQLMLPRLLSVVSGLNLFFLVFYAIAFAINYQSLFASSAAAWVMVPIALTLLLVSLLVSIPLVYVTYTAWARGEWNTKRRVAYTLVTVLVVIFLFLMNYYNLIGYKY